MKNYFLKIIALVFQIIDKQIIEFLIIQRNQDRVLFASKKMNEAPGLFVGLVVPFSFVFLFFFRINLFCIEKASGVIILSQKGTIIFSSLVYTLVYVYIRSIKGYNFYIEESNQLDKYVKNKYQFVKKILMLLFLTGLHSLIALGIKNYRDSIL
jgi:hypothetical protein